MLGTLLNAGAILVGAVLGLTTTWDVPAPRQQQLKVLLGVATTWFGLNLLWEGLVWTGHLYGTRLAPEQKRPLPEYLKTL